MAKTLGRIGLVVGFLGPVLFYLSPYSFPTFESHLLCPACPYVSTFATRADWVEMALKFGLFCGVLYALIGFAIGYAISKVRAST